MLREQQQTISMRTSYECTMFAPAQLLRSWRGHLGIYQDDLGLSVTGDGERMFTWGGLASDFIFIP
jgi:hypothetical protein